MKTPIKHLVECHCVLPQHRKSETSNYFSFPVFSIVENDSDTVISKFAACPNCGVIHEVFDICRSRIADGGKDNSNAIISKEDVKLMIPTQLASVLESYECDIATWEYAMYVIQEEAWGTNLVLTSAEDGDTGEVSGKYLRIEGPLKFQLGTYARQTRIE